MDGTKEKKAKKWLSNVADALRPGKLTEEQPKKNTEPDDYVKDVETIKGGYSKRNHIKPS